MSKGVFDIEANGFLDTITKVHSIVIQDLTSGTLSSYDPSNIGQGLEHLRTFDELIGHNIIAYDLPALGLIFNFATRNAFKNTRIVDTLVISRYLWPERPWGHSLEDWGAHLGNPKIHFNEWEVWTPKMQRYCEQDVRVNVDILAALEKEYGGTIDGFKIYQDWASL